MFRRSGVVLDVITVVEEQEIVEPAVVTRRAVFVFEVSLKPAKAQSNEPAGKITCHKKPGC